MLGVRAIVEVKSAEKPVFARPVADVAKAGSAI